MIVSATSAFSIDPRLSAAQPSSPLGIDLDQASSFAVMIALAGNASQTQTYAFSGLGMFGQASPTADKGLAPSSGVAKAAIETKSGDAAPSALRSIVTASDLLSPLQAAPEHKVSPSPVKDQGLGGRPAIASKPPPPVLAQGAAYLQSIAAQTDPAITPSSYVAPALDFASTELSEYEPISTSGATARPITGLGSDHGEPSPPAILEDADGPAAADHEVAAKPDWAAQDDEASADLSVLVYRQDGGVEVVAAAPQMSPSEQARLRQVAEDVSAELGVNLGGISLNGAALGQAPISQIGGWHGRNPG